MKFLSRLLGKRTPGTPSGASDAGAHIERALEAAGLHRGNHGTAAIRDTIDRALESAGILGARPSSASPGGMPPAADAHAAHDAEHAARVEPRGQFLESSFANAHGRREYRLYIPAGYDLAGPALPLLVMLHGCTQTGDDFATGTRMNTLADRHGFLVAYPLQVAKANHARCWNWFRPKTSVPTAASRRSCAGIARQVMAQYHVDPDRVFVAGLSAGAAMAVVLAATMPDLVRAIGVHSGLPYAVAHDVPSAFAAMQGRGATPPRDVRRTIGVPMIVFHGDADRTVAESNADALAQAAARPGLQSVARSGRVPGGHAYTREVTLDDAGIPWFERWTVKGAGHAWSGGDASGTYTDPAGPDASSAMVEFFLQLPRRDS